MANITMSMDDNFLRRARKAAIDQNTTISDLFRSFLGDVVRREESRRDYVAAELDKLFEASQASSGGARHSRDSLHER